ncbi:MAG: RagB/SusD family nutrient uptake outer membrane protein, partial [Sphingobacteriales bacterium]
FLIRAECSARTGNTEEAMADLNALMEKRWVRGKFKPFTAASPEDALTKILIERRKELIMRGVRWSDLRRLNKDPRFAKTLKRVLINGTDTKTYTLLPGDPRYILKIPADVIALTGMEQNPD